MRGIMRVSAATVAVMLLAISGSAQEASATPMALTLKRAIELALQNSKDIQVAKIQASVADKAALINKAQFMPNVYAGSGLGYTYGIPETPGGRAPAIFNVTYTEQVINEPLRGQGKEQQEQVKAQKVALEDARNSVIVRTASAYLELVKVRHSAELLQKELVSVYSLLGKFNNYAQYFNHFQRNNYNLGIQAQVAIFSPSTRANVALAQTNLLAAKASFANKQNQVSSDVRRKTRRVRETDAGKEVARLELQLVQQDLAQLQARFEEGKESVQVVEKARVNENEKWMALLGTTFERQHAQHDLL